MYSAKVVLFLALAVLVSSKSIQENRCGVNGVPYDYDCSGKHDGNYNHPTLCTHYVTCTGKTLACEFQCAMGQDGPLYYVQDSGPDPAYSRCDYPAVANCHREPCKADL